MICRYYSPKQTCRFGSILGGEKKQNVMGELYPVCVSVSWFWWQLDIEKQVLENICWMSFTLISPSASSRSRRTSAKTRGGLALVQRTKPFFFFFCLMSTYDSIVSFYSLIQVRTQSSLILLWCDNLSLKIHIIGNKSCEVGRSRFFFFS